ncbi:porin [Photobacterium profundum]|nr:porin [Photobacterium profundum]
MKKHKKTSITSGRLEFYMSLWQHSKYIHNIKEYLTTMKKALLPVFISAALLSGQAFAQVIYQDDTNKLELGGVAVLDVAEPMWADEADLSLGRSIFNIAAERKMANDWSIDFKLEWDQFVNSPNSDSSNFRNRLSYITINNEDLGNLRFGKQWSAYHDVARYMDNMVIIDPDATPIYSEGADGGFAATGRGDELIAYRYSQNGLNVSAHYGLSTDGYNAELTGEKVSRDYNYAAAVSYDFDFGLSLGTTYLENKVKVESGSSNIGLNDGDSQKALTFAGNYEVDGLKVAAAYTQGTKIHKAGLFGPDGKWADANAFDIYTSYLMDFGIKPFAYYSSIDFDDNSVGATGKRDIIAGGVSYAFAAGVIASVELHSYELSEFGGAKSTENGGGFNLIYAF